MTWKHFKGGMNGGYVTEGVESRGVQKQLRFKPDLLFTLSSMFGSH